MEDDADATASASTSPVKASERAKATGDLDRVTDYVEERELDASAAADKMRAVLGSAAASKRRDDKGTNVVRAREADVKSIVEEMEVDSKLAERALVNAKGDVIAALQTLME